jgi:NAD(P)-dependent dehydrogenase (short-subunit alcohol dehydrogenase family)
MRRPRLILVTGCTRGLGRALVDDFVARGITVAGCGRNARAIRELEDAYPSPHSFATVDVSDDAWVANWARIVTANLGAPDLLINNAAVVAPNGPLWQVPVDEIHATLATNVAGVIHVIRHFLPRMIDAGSGVIINMSSGWGRSTSPDVAAYCASKWAIEGLTQALAQELPKGLAAVTLNPGIIDTEMLRAVFGASAGLYPSPETWVKHAAPFILKLGSRDNGKALSVPGVPQD